MKAIETIMDGLCLLGIVAACLAWMWVFYPHAVTP